MQKNEHKENLLFILKQVVILWLRDRTTSGEKSKKARKIKETAAGNRKESLLVKKYILIVSHEIPLWYEKFVRNVK